MKPWTPDAASISVESLPFCSSYGLKDFCESNISDAAKILVAPKGFGKTLFLKYKSHSLRQKLSGIPIYPLNGSNIEYLRLAIDWANMHHLRRATADVWALLWEFCLVLKGVQLIGALETVDDDYIRSGLVSRDETVSGVLSQLLSDPDNLGTSLSARLAKLKKAFNECDEPAVIFIDNADEMFFNLDTEKQQEAVFIEKREEGDQATRPTQWIVHEPTVWSAAQVGLMLAVREIERSHRKLAVYTSLRAEAVYTTNHPLALQAKMHVVPIEYTKSDLLSIFNYHVNLMALDRLAKPSGQSGVEKFIGRPRVAHSYVKNDDGTPYEEEFLSLVLRHTNNSPREMVTICGSIANMTIDERTNDSTSAEALRTKINFASRTLFDSFRANLIPAWKDSFNDAISRRDSATFQIEQGVVKSDIEAIRGLFSIGMIGYSKETSRPDRFIQTFIDRWDQRFSRTDSTIPNAIYYFMHPWIYDFRREMQIKFDLDKSNIFGNGCEFREPSPVYLRVSRDGNGKISLYVNGKLDGKSVESEIRNTHKKYFVFFVYALLTCQRLNTNVFDQDQFLETIKSLGSTYFPNDQYENPFADANHRSHANASLVRELPALASELKRWSQPIKFLYEKKGMPTSLCFEFLHVKNLEIDL
jgi:hypothetical protein